MRRLYRPVLSSGLQNQLDRKQDEVIHKLAKGTLNIESVWRSARQTKPLLAVLKALRKMTGQRERCVYCVDSHATDIEHFWPKAAYPSRMFVWPNLLLSCTECGRFKLDRFPLAEGKPLLVDPTREDPWRHLDFDPDTGNMTARFDSEANNWSARGSKTVEILQLDRREALAAGYSRTFRRLASLVDRHLTAGDPAEGSLADALRESDDHGLLGWCLFAAGQDVPPFRELRTRRPKTWAACQRALGNS